MKTITALAAMTALAVACGSAGGTSAASPARAAVSSLPEPSRSPYVPTSTTLTLKLLLADSPPADGTSAVSTIKCTGPIGASDPVAFVTLHGSGGSVLRDYADPAHPRTVCELPGMTYVPVIDARHILLSVSSGYYAVVQVPEVIPTWFQLPLTDNPGLIAVSPNLDQIVYSTPDMAGNADNIHLVDSAGDHVVARPPDPHQAPCACPEDSKAGDYQHLGGDFYVLEQPQPALNSLFVFQNGIARLDYVPPSGGAPTNQPQPQPEYPVWSPTSETLYYRQGGAVWRWTANGGAKKWLPGVAWAYPTISGDGKHLAYADYQHDLYLLDLTTGVTRVIGKARTLPVFLSPNLLWYRSDASGTYGPGGGQPLIYDLNDGSESPSVIDSVGSVWPSTSSNF